MDPVKVETVVIGVPDFWRSFGGWEKTPVAILESKKGKWLGQIICSDNESRVEYTVVESPQGELLLFAENLNDNGGFASTQDVYWLYPEAQQTWNAISKVQLPPANTYKAFWRHWVAELKD